MDKAKETLEKQLELLSERSSACINDNDLCVLTSAMTVVAKTMFDICAPNRICVDGKQFSMVFREIATHGKDEEAQ